MSAIREIFMPLLLRTLKAASLPGPGPLIKISTSLSPLSLTETTACSTAVVAAKGVDLRLPLNPALPVEPQPMAFPEVSVKVIKVLLKVAVTYILPLEIGGRFFLGDFLIEGLAINFF